MADREEDDRTGPKPPDGGLGGNIPVPPQPPPAPLLRMLAFIAALAGVIAGLLGYDLVLLVLCALSAVFNGLSLVLGRGPIAQQGGLGGNIPVPPRPIFIYLALLAAVAGVIAGLLGRADLLLILCGASAILTLIGLLTERARASR